MREYIDKSDIWQLWQVESIDHATGGEEPVHESHPARDPDRGQFLGTGQV